MKTISLGLFLLLACAAQGQVQLSPEAEISVLTLGPWQGQVYTAFGHSAFRVKDPVHGIDDAYNYGVFDYDRPNFYLNFARGHNIYQLGVTDYRNFEYSYIYYNRSIHEQVLNLRADQKQRLYEFLEWNARPENREYLYDYFYDNCATKVPEVMKTVFGDTVKFDGSYINTEFSFRELTDLYLEEQPWGDLGIDIGLGLPTDKIATPYEYMFLPDYVETGFAHATITHNGVEEPLVGDTKIIYQATPESHSASWFHPLIVFTLFLILTLYVTYKDVRRKKISMGYDIALFVITGLLGVSLLLLWTATSHRASAANMNMLWALPTNFVAVFAMNSRKPWLRTYFLVVAIICALLLVCWPWLPQKLHYSLIPLVLAIGVRAYTQYALRKRAA